MKKIFKLTLAVAFVLMGIGTASAQKFGRVDIEAIIPNMPEFVQANVEFEEFRKEKVNEVELLQVELNQRIAEFEKNYNTYSESMRQNKYMDLQQSQQRVAEFEQAAQQELQAYYGEKVNPVYEKAYAAVAKVAEAGKYTAIYLTNGTANQNVNIGLAYIDTKTVVDITAEVKKELGIE